MQIFVLIIHHIQCLLKRWSSYVHFLFLVSFYSCFIIYFNSCHGLLSSMCFSANVVQKTGNMVKYFFLIHVIYIKLKYQYLSVEKKEINSFAFFIILYGGMEWYTKLKKSRVMIYLQISKSTRCSLSAKRYFWELKPKREIGNNSTLTAC